MKRVLSFDPQRNIGKYCGRRDPFNVTSTTSKMFIEFRSDGSLNYAGFRAKFVVVAKTISFTITLKNIIVAVIGKPVKLQCQVKGGSSKVVISWNKDGTGLSSDGLHYTIMNFYSGKSTLLLDKVSIRDAGVYGCLASDVHTGENISAYGSLQLKGK